MIPNAAAATYAAQAEPDSVDFEVVQAAGAGTGVISGCACTPNASGSTLVVAVAAGAVYVAGVALLVAAGTVTPGAADGTHPRFDLVTVDNTGAKAVVAGTAAATPVFPAIPANRLVLAAVYIPATATSITAGNIVDKRQTVNVTHTINVPRAPALIVGESTIPRNVLFTQQTMTSGTLRLTYWRAHKTEDITQVRAITGTTAAGATPTLCRLGFYSVDLASGDLTLEAACANDTSLFASTSTAYTRSLTTTLSKVADRVYAAAALVVTGAAAPGLQGQSVGLVASERALDVRMTGVFTGQTDLPSSISAGSVADNASGLYIVAVP